MSRSGEQVGDSTQPCNRIQSLQETPPNQPLSLQTVDRIAKEYTRSMQHGTSKHQARGTLSDDSDSSKSSVENDEPDKKQKRHDKKDFPWFERE